MKKVNKSPHPEWALKYRSPGTELRYLKEHYYLYSVEAITVSSENLLAKVGIHIT
ncbi:hypothetical protein HY745_10980 [Candidatus Desantisbacteria bacterium]|nr:hypothetical protein [Candidatus Desantisbacteria bacterium]